MRDLLDLQEVSHVWGGDLQASSTGDLALVKSVDRSTQRVLRRLCTNAGDYLFHPAYGAGLPGKVGSLTEPAKARALIRGQMALEASVARTPAPVAEVSTITNGLSASVSYVVAPEKVPAVLSFSLEA